MPQTRKKRNHNNSKGLKKSGSKRNLNKKSKKSRRMNTRKIKGGWSWLKITKEQFDNITNNIEKNFIHDVGNGLKERIKMYNAETSHIHACKKNDTVCGKAKAVSYESRVELGELLLHMYETQDRQTKIIIDDHIMTHLKTQIQHWINKASEKNEKYNPTYTEDEDEDHEVREFG